MSPFPRPIPDGELYLPLFSPWMSTEFQRRYDRIAPYTLVTRDRCYVLEILALQSLHLSGEIWECGVYRGGTAMLIEELIDRSPRQRDRDGSR